MKINDFAKSLVTGKNGIIQATYPNEKYLLYTGENYEHLFVFQMRIISSSQVSPRVRNSEINTKES